MDGSPPAGPLPDGSAPGDRTDLSPVDRRRRTALLARSLTRTLVNVTLVLVLYFLLPLDRPFTGGTVLVLVGGLLALSVLVAWQIRGIFRARYPALRAMETLAFTLPVFLILFASAYVRLETTDPQAFSEPLTRIDSLYFVVTVFATVGFGDITAVSQLARVMATVQMVCDLLLLGLVGRAVISAVQHGTDRRWTDRAERSAGPAGSGLTRAATAASPERTPPR